MSQNLDSLHSRRRFLGEASCAAVGSVPLLSTLLNLEMANRVMAAGGPGGSQRKSLVCIFLSGGCDTYNVLVPRDNGGSDSPYAKYAASRSNLSHPVGSLQDLNGTDSQGRAYGLHPSLEKISWMFNGQGAFAGRSRLSFVANIGTLIERLGDKNDFSNGAIALPKALFSHRDQIEQWQTSVPQGQSVLSGWGGRAADILHSRENTEQTGGFYMPMNFSLSGNAAFGTGREEGQFAITSSGALTFLSRQNSDNPLYDRKNAALRAMVQSPVEDHYQNLFHRAFAEITGGSVERGEDFQTNFDGAEGTSVDISSIDAAIKTALGLSGNTTTLGAILNGAGFPNHYFANNLRAAIKTVFVRDQLRLCRQTVFVEYGGWDHHGELLNTQAAMLDILDDSLYAYQLCLEALGLADDVLSFSCSDFGRTLRSNGQGTDHAWSGHQFVFGGPVDGGSVLGDFPEVEIDGPDDIGRGGRIYPKLSVDEYVCELLQWFGVTPTDMGQILPNIGNFYNVNSGSRPVGFLL